MRTPHDLTFFTQPATISVLGDVFCTPDSLGAVVITHHLPNVSRTEEHYRALPSHHDLLCVTLAKVISILGGTVKDWEVLDIVRERPLPALDSTAVTTTLAAIILGLAAYRRDYALEFMLFLIGDVTVPWRETDTELAICAEIREAVAQKAGAWAVKVAEFAQQAFGDDTAIACRDSLIQRGSLAREFVTQFLGNRIESGKYVEAISRTAACKCGVSWLSVSLVDRDSGKITRACCCVANCFAPNLGCKVITRKL
jgi:hypothetical protein